MKYFLFFLLLCVAQLSYSQKPALNPTPQSISYKGGFLHSEKGFYLKRGDSSLCDVLSFTTRNRKSIPLSISISPKKAVAAGVAAKKGAYKLTIRKNGVHIIGFDETGGFYAIQTLHQLNEDNKLPFVTILDAPDFPYRGVVEGFYGNPWSHEVRLSLIDFYGKYKLNSYLYGPKDDPYHSSPHWREPYPLEEQVQIKELIDACKRNRVNFVWAIHPGKDIQWNEEDYTHLLNKFEAMYTLGVRDFALFFDDISGIGTDPKKQANLLNRIHEEFVEEKADVSPLIFTPTEYTELWANPDDDGYLSVLGRTLHPSVQVMWTGHTVSGDITDSTLEFVNSRIQRPAFIWWNFPVTDYIKNFLMQGPVYGLTQNATIDTMVGLVSNPMEHGEASKLALYGVADYTWNISNYQPLENWEEAIAILEPNATEAYRTFAIHSSDNETGYRRDESWETDVFSIDNYSESQINALMKEFEKIKQAPGTIMANSENKQLLTEIKPWLVEMEKLGERGLQTLTALNSFKTNDKSTFWHHYRQAVMTPKQLEQYNKHKLGSYKLQPFITNTTQRLSAQFYEELSGISIPKTKAISSFKENNQLLAQHMFDDNHDTFYHINYSQKEGSWVGIDLGREVSVSTIYISQGRNSIDDSDFIDRASLQYSIDGERWTTLRDNIIDEYEITYAGLPVNARYIRLKRLPESGRTNWIAIREFSVNPLTNQPVLVTNIADYINQKISHNHSKTSILPKLEMVTFLPDDYIGIEFPLNTQIEEIKSQLKQSPLQLEYSVNGVDWMENATSAKIVRFINKSQEPIHVQLKQFEVFTKQRTETSLAKAFDGNLDTFEFIKKPTNIIIPEHTRKVYLLCHLNESESLHIEQIDHSGHKIRSFTMDDEFIELPINDRVETLRVLTPVQLYEVIFE